MTDRWSAHAEAYRDSDAHRQGPDLELLVEWAEGETALDVAAGGGNLALRLREAGFNVVTVDPSPGMQADVLARAEDLPFADESFDTVGSRIAPHHFEDVGAAMRELARVARRVVLVADLRYLDETGEAGRAAARSDPRSQLLGGRVAGAVRAGRAGRRGSVSCSTWRSRLDPWLARAGCEGEEATQVRDLLADRIRDGRLRLPRIALKGRK